MSANFAALAYLVAGVLFILALRGLSSPETSRRGNSLGMVGMGIAIVVTLFVSGAADGLTWMMILGGVAIGGGIGALIARRIAMTAMPEQTIAGGVPLQTVRTDLDRLSVVPEVCRPPAVPDDGHLACQGQPASHRHFQPRGKGQHQTHRLWREHRHAHQ